MAQDQSRGGSPPESAEIKALAELALCESLAQTSGWAARWSAELARADAALLWAPDALHPAFLCIAAFGGGTERVVRRSVSRETGLVHDLVRDREPVLLQADQLASTDDPFLKVIPAPTVACLFVPLQAERIVVGILALAFHRMPDRGVLQNLQGFLKHATPALARALRAERKTGGMLYAIERLTSLYDLSKAFGSTIDLSELSAIIAGKAADFMSAEVASLWTLDPEADEVTLAATAVNTNYDISAAPEAVGGSLVGDVLAERAPLRRHDLPEDDPVRTENPAYPISSFLAVPLIEDDAPIGAIVVVNKRGRHPEFNAADEELLVDIERQAVRALRNARQHEAEKKVQELHALLTVSHEITATLDLDKVMATVVNASAALVSYERCALAILQRGRLQLGAVSGLAEIDRSDASVKRTEALLEWVFFSGDDVAVTRQEDGTIVTDRPETEEKFRAFFEASGRNAFYGVVLKDDEGKLGVLGFECDEPIVFEAETRDLLQILVNQATVALRNAQLYQQVPLAGLWQPLLQRWRKVQAVPTRRAVSWAGGALLLLAVLALVPWRIRVAGPARVLPLRRVSVTSSVDGFIATVHRREGDAVAAGDLLATLRDERYRAELAEASSEKEIAESELNRFRAEGDAAAVYQALAKRDALAAKIQLAQSRMARTEIRAPVAGIVITPRLDEKTGQYLASAAEFCHLADISEVTVEVAVPENEAAQLRVGEPLWAKMNPYPGRTFHGTVQHIAAAVHEEGEERFVIAESRIENPAGLLKPGMLGRAKVSIGRHSLATALFRKPLRYAWLKLWPLLP